MPKPKKASPKLKAKKARSAKVLQQVAALPVRPTPDGDLEVLLVTSRETRRWIVPKGWPMKGRKPHRAAAIEACEEAGVIGPISKTPVGFYTYAKRLPDGGALPCRVAVYCLTVTKQLATWPEKGQRDVQWVSSEAAAVLVDEPELADLIREQARVAVAAQLRAQDEPDPL
ncbi:NUDIX hydrolase [Methylobacterium sp. ID0610]|uniref:NUDIX hydrolase n=1 Tax=Methylobacterium carpenticola TaxID=3344827 RepID=UPI0036934E74